MDMWKAQIASIAGTNMETKESKPYHRGMTMLLDRNAETEDANVEKIRAELARVRLARISDLSLATGIHRHTVAKALQTICECGEARKVRENTHQSPYLWLGRCE